MAGNKTSLNTTTNYLLGLGSLLLICIICAAFSFTGNDEFDLARQGVLLRKIGHEILLHSGDSTSRVMPVKRIATNEYQLAFENEFTFQPDSLVQIVRRSLVKDQLADNYIVNVVKYNSTDVVFGYAIFKNPKDNIMACSGRKQPKSRYLVNIKFQSNGISTAQKGYLVGGLPLLAFIGLMISRSVKSRKSVPAPVTTVNDQYSLGNTLFDPKTRQITTAEIVTELTIKENKLLLIFAQSPNAIIKRERLQKEIWEDEGVIVGRSLDMFISKLRKKLDADLSVRIVNIHGKGYKLEIDSAMVTI